MRLSLIRRDTDFHQLVMGSAAEIPDQVGVHHVGLPRPEQPSDLASGVKGVALQAAGSCSGSRSASKIDSKTSTAAI